MELFSMETLQRYLRKARRGGILITALAFVSVSSLLMVGMLTLSVSFYARAQTESDYEAALSLAEAGVNYEMQKISVNTANADQVSVGNPSGPSYTLGNGTFTVYCMNKDGTTPWTPPSNLYVVCTGTVNGASRSVKVSAKGYSTTMGDMALWSDGAMTITPSLSVSGEAGSNGKIKWPTSTTVSGTTTLYGGGASWGSSIPPGIVWATNAKPFAPMTVSAIADAYFGAGGLVYVSTHNNNATATPPIVNDTIVSSLPVTYTLTTGNYYIKDFNLSASSAYDSTPSRITLDNRNGPVNIWFGPSGYSSAADFNSPIAIVEMDRTTVANHCTMYVSTKGIKLTDISQMDCSVYAFNGAASTVTKSSGGASALTMLGGIMADLVSITGPTTINYVKRVDPPGVGNDYYGYDDSWTELNGM